MFFKQIVKGLAHCLFGRCEAGALRVRGIAHQCKDSLSAKLRKPLQVNGITEYRCVIYLKVSCVDNNTRRGINRQGGGIHDTVIRPDKFHTQLSQIDGLPELYHLALCAFNQIMFLQLILDNSHGQPCRIDRHIDLAEHIGKRTDMILMSVRNDECLDPVDVILQVGHIGNDEINSQHVVRRERQTTIHHNNTVFVFKGSNVHANLFQPAQRDHFQLGTTVIHFFLQLNFLHILHSSRRA